MFTITKEFAFEACHCLTGLRPDHPCMRPHGHSYRLQIELQSEELNQHGFVQDYRELDDVKQFVDRFLDHQDLNAVRERPFNAQEPAGDGSRMFTPSTAENIARVLFRLFKPRYPMLSAVRLSETAKTWAEYRPSK